MRTIDRISELMHQAAIYRGRAQTANAGSRQALETLAARHEQVARQLTRGL